MDVSTFILTVGYFLVIAAYIGFIFGAWQLLVTLFDTQHPLKKYLISLALSIFFWIIGHLVINYGFNQRYIDLYMKSQETYDELE